LNHGAVLFFNTFEAGDLLVNNTAATVASRWLFVGTVEGGMLSQKGSTKKNLEAKKIGSYRADRL
jgi:hypothetical protein